MLVENQADLERIGSVRVAQGHGCVKLMFGNLNKETTLGKKGHTKPSGS